MLSSIISLKEQANDYYKKSARQVNSQINSSEYLKQACVLYGQAIEQIIQLEVDNSFEESLSISELDVLSILRPTLFLNLALCNIKLGVEGIEGAMYTCNAAIHLCNDPSIKLVNLPDCKVSISSSIRIIEPIIRSHQSLAVKALYRRGMCYEHTREYTNAYNDYQQASRLSVDNDKDINLAVTRILSLIHHHAIIQQQPSSLTPPQQTPQQPIQLNSTLSSSSNSAIDCSNGGKCWDRRGFWSQTVSDVTVHLPLDNLIQALSDSDTEWPVDISPSSSSSWSVSFKPSSITIRYSHLPTQPMTLQLKHKIHPADCLWSLRSNTASSDILPNNSSKSSSWLILELSKDLTLPDDVQWHPGVEWWSCVFIGDETIDTVSCTIGSDISQLPEDAQRRAEQEHQAFMSMSPAEQEKARNALIEMKKVR